MYKILFLIFLLTFANANSFNKEATTQPIYTQSGEEKYWCPVCGMSIKIL